MFFVWLQVLLAGWAGRVWWVYESPAAAFKILVMKFATRCL
jgi:hypothetical protein